MKVLVTGAKGFVGKNLTTQLRSNGCHEIYEYDLDTEKSLLDEYTKDSEFVFHLAGVNRPENESGFMEGNYGFTAELIDAMKKNCNKSPILMTSSIQADHDNPYGRSKRAGEDLIFEYGRETGAGVYCYRLPNLFGKWSKPYYNSVVATFCHNISRDIEITVNDPDKFLPLCYIDDVVEEFLKALAGDPSVSGKFCFVPVEYSIKLSDLAYLIKSFKKSRYDLRLPDMKDDLTRKLYSTYLSYIPKEDLAYDLLMHKDDRGSFTEFIKMQDGSQVSVNIAKPGITKGNHWHMSKNEKFLVVNGKGMIRSRDLNTGEVAEFKVSGERLEIVDIPPGWTHSITNVGSVDMVTIIWVNEIYDPNKPDTFFMEV